MMIGLSLSYCIYDIAAGKVAEADVTKIITSTNYPDEETFKEALVRYSNIYWRGFPQAYEIATRLYNAGKIEQPRVSGGHGQTGHILRKHWIMEESDGITNC